VSDRSSSASGGLGFSGALFLVFLVLKLLGKITWSWLWVSAPLWGGVALFLAIMLGVVVFAFGATAIESFASWIRRRRR